MSSITNVNNSGYYQLSNPSAGAGGASTSPTSALMQALGISSDSQSAASPSAAYLLDLSPQAQQYLNGGASATSPINSSSANFTLTAQQQQSIATILAKYKDAPYTQATFDNIQNDLQATGLDPATLSRVDQAQNFNATELFIDDLNGDYSDAAAMTNPDESTKSSNYMQQIISEWKTISGNTSASAPDPTAATGAT